MDYSAYANLCNAIKTARSAATKRKKFSELLKWIENHVSNDYDVETVKKMWDKARSAYPLAKMHIVKIKDAWVVDNSDWSR